MNATFAEAPRQRNTRDENHQIKEGKAPEDWEKPGNVHRIRRKDADARWAVKNKERHFGYKDHVKVDVQSKLITEHEVMDAALHDSQAIIALLDEKDKVLYADSAYSGSPIAERLPEGIENQIHEKGYRSRPLREEQKTGNKRKSRIRPRIGHVFGCMAGIPRGITVRSIGMERAKFNIGLTGLI